MWRIRSTIGFVAKTNFLKPPCFFLRTESASTNPVVKNLVVDAKVVARNEVAAVAQVKAIASANGLGRVVRTRPSLPIRQGVEGAFGPRRSGSRVDCVCRGFKEITSVLNDLKIET